MSFRSRTDADGRAPSNSRDDSDADGAAPAADHFEFARADGRDASGGAASDGGIVLNAGDGRPDPDPTPTAADDADPDPAPAPIAQPEEPAAPTAMGRPDGATPGTPTTTPPSPAPGDTNADYGRAPGAEPGPVPDAPVDSYTSGGDASTSYNVTIDFEGSNWTATLQDAFIAAADYLSAIILGDLPDAVVNGVAIDDISISATLEGIDGVGGVLGSAGTRALRDDGTFLPATGAMTFDIADAENQLGIGQWGNIVLHEMMHALGFGTLWDDLGLTTGSVAGGDIRFTGQNAYDTYLTEFADIAAGDAGSALGIPVETDGGPGTAGGHWDEALFGSEIMTGFVDPDAFVSDMTIASLGDMGYDTVFDSPYDPNDLSGPIPADPVMDLFA